MNTSLIVQIIALATSILQGFEDNTNDLDLEETLLELLRTGAQAY